MKHWIKLTDEYANALSDGVRRKVRLQDGQEMSAMWVKREGCFYNSASDWGAYMDDPCKRPTHVLVGSGKQPTHPDRS